MDDSIKLMDQRNTVIPVIN